MTATTVTRLDLIRHGEHKLGDVVCGVTDPELSDKGWEQLRNTCHRLQQEGSQWDLCVTSPRKRCAEFARQISGDLGIECIEEQGFAEVDFGNWEALSYTEISSLYPGQWQSWLSNPDHPAPHGGEQYSEFLDRVNRSVSSLVAQQTGRRILLFAHGGVVRGIFYAVLGLRPGSLSRFSVPHACHSRIMAYHSDGEEDWFQLDRHNT